MRVNCPNCQSRIAVRTSRELTPTYREWYGACGECGWSGNGHVAVDKTLTPSLRPNPQVSLPIDDEAKAILLKQLQQ